MLHIQIDVPFQLFLLFVNAMSRNLELNFKLLASEYLDLFTFKNNNNIMNNKIASTQKKYN